MRGLARSERCVVAGTPTHGRRGFRPTTSLLAGTVLLASRNCAAC
jgi:hypothetical protein